jgi:hypothetical protein
MCLCLCFVVLLLGTPALITAFLDGTIVFRSCLTMELMFTLDPGFSSNVAVWSIQPIPGQSAFAAAGDSGSVTVWRINQPL